MRAPAQRPAVPFRRAWFILILLWLPAGCGGPSESEQAILRDLPALPGLDRQPRELAQRLRSADRRIRKGEDPIAALAELSMLYHANGFLEEADSGYGILIREDPEDARWKHRKATIMAGFGMLQRAVPLWEEVVRLAPGYAPARIRLGDALLKLNRLDEAESVFRELTRVDPKNAYGRSGLGRVAMAREDWAAAQLHLERAGRLSGFRIGADLLVDIYERTGNTAGARALLESNPIGAFADTPDPWMDEVVEHCRRADLLATEGGWVVHEGNLAEGLRLLERAAELDPDDPYLFYQLGTVAVSMGNRRQAETYLRRSVELKPDLADSWVQLILLYRDSGQAEAAARAVDAGFRHNPQSPGMLLELGKQLRDQGQPAAAIDFFEQSIALRPNEAIGYIELALTWFREGRMDAGARQMEAALKAEPMHPMALSTLAFYAIENRDREMADHYLRQCRQQPRIASERLQQLEDRFRQQFR